MLKPLQIGPYSLSSIETCSFALDGGAMFGVVPKTLWEKTNPADEANRIDMRARALLIQKPASGSEAAKNILVDCGMGHKWADKFRSIYKVDFSQWTLEQSLKEKGLKADDITEVILTHLHFDHAGGMTTLENPSDLKSKLLPTFPNARVFVQKANWDLGWNPNEKDRASYLKENYSIYQDEASLKRKLELLETRSTEPTGKMAFSSPSTHEDVIYPGISVEVSHGHTPGMQLVRIHDGKTSLIYCADLIPTSSHVKIPFIMAYDCYPIFILQEKKRLLNRAVDENTYLFYEHCPKMNASRVKRTDKGDFEIGESLSF
jgi:glyoxylase-like metal-dependent hydrolase (beta-lactamase superfamily II)